MNTLFRKKFLLLAAATIVILSIINFSCQKNVSDNQKIQSTDPTPDQIIAQAGSETPPYNLNVVMKSGTGEFAFVKFRQHPDTARIINLDTWVANLQPNHSYLLQRAVDPFTDSTTCASTAWLTLGFGLTPASIHTDSKGYGFAPLWRDVTSAAPGTEFYIHFQIVDSLTSLPVLSSDCYTYTVR